MFITSPPTTACGPVDPREIHESNVTGTRNLLDSARSAGVEKFIYTSTVATVAVPREGTLPNEETQSSVGEMIGEYKRSKFEAEQVALQAARAGRAAGGDCEPDNSGGTGRLETNADRENHCRFSERTHAGLRGHRIQIFVPVEDCAHGHLLAAEKWRVGQRYILGGRNLALKQMLDLLAAASGRLRAAMKFPHVLAYAAGFVDSRSSARLLGREPQIPLEGVRMARHKMFVAFLESRA